MLIPTQVREKTNVYVISHVGVGVVVVIGWFNHAKQYTESFSLFISCTNMIYNIPVYAQYIQYQSIETIDQIKRK